MVLRQETKEWNEVPLTHGYTENSRGIGVADMAYALRTGRSTGQIQILHITYLTLCMVFRFSLGQHSL